MYVQGDSLPRDTSLQKQSQLVQDLDQWKKRVLLEKHVNKNYMRSWGCSLALVLPDLERIYIYDQEHLPQVDTRQLWRRLPSPYENTKL